MVPHSQPNHRRTTAWVQNGQLFVSNRNAFAEQFYLPPASPTDDGMHCISPPHSETGTEVSR